VYFIGIFYIVLVYDFRNGDIQPSARFPELSVCGYFFNGKLCVNRPRNIAELEQNIGEEINAILM
jgi:hypothetical protein